MSTRRVGFAVALTLGLLPALAGAQVLAGIAGSVKDTTGAVLPGVTVEASSPALIEKVRSVVTDEGGNYKFTELRPGTYTVTFTLPGFSTFKREGIELTSGFTANVSPEMRVGGVEETVTVSGSSPIVDVQNVRVQTVLNAQVLSELPVSKTWVSMGALTLGATGGGGFTGTGGNRDVGGNSGEGTNSLAIHGSRGDGSWFIDGMKTNSLTGGGFNRRYFSNQDAIQENVLDTGGMSAEAETGGVSTNTLLKEGANGFKGLGEGEFTNGSMQNSNLGDRLTARGITAPNRVREIWSLGGALGGPAVKDKLWFHTAYRWWGAREDQAGIYYNKPELVHTPFFEADLTRPGYTESWVKDSTTRMTYQASPKHKFSANIELQESCTCNQGLGATRSPESTVDFRITGPALLAQGNWSFPATNKLLFQAGVAVRNSDVRNKRQPELNATDVGKLELATGLNYGPLVGTGFSSGGYGYIGFSKQLNTMFNVSYVTGSHAFKAGVQTLGGTNPAHGGLNDVPIQLQLRNRVPTSILQVAAPANFDTQVKLLAGLFAQDQWTVNRLTLNLGIRYDGVNSQNPASVRPASFFLPELRFSEVKNVPNWKDISPRAGAAFDLFGNGKTAIKASFGRYVISESTSIAAATNPQNALAVSVTRPWTDTNGDFKPDCVLQNNAANGECGAASSSTFGTTVFNTRYDPDFVVGWGKRPFNWQSAVSFQHELGGGIGLYGGYFRTWYGNLTTTDNQRIVPADFNQYCVTAPTDSRLGSVSGTQVCGLYDLNPAKFGQIDNLIRTEDGFKETFNGVDLGMRARFGNGGVLNGGVSLGNTQSDNCTVVDNPGFIVAAASPEQRLCNFGNRQDQFKVNGSYPLKWGITASAIYQNIPGTSQLATFVATNAQVAPSLGRNLAACGAAVTCTQTVSVGLLEPNTKRERRASQLDLRFSRITKFGAQRLRVGFDIYNALNRDDVLGMVNTFGSTWLRPSGILAGRLYKLNAQFDF